MITHLHHLVVMWYVWFSFTVSFFSHVVSIVLEQSCSSSYLLVAWKQHFFYESSPLACHLSCFGVSDFCIVQELKTSMLEWCICLCVCGEAASRQLFPCLFGNTVLREHSSVIKELSVNGKPSVHEILKICAYGVVLVVLVVCRVSRYGKEFVSFDRKMFLAY